jgi:hypothetical protein
MKIYINPNYYLILLLLLLLFIIIIKFYLNLIYVLYYN